MDNFDAILDMMMDGLNDIENNINGIYQPAINNLNNNITDHYEPRLIEINENIYDINTTAIQYNKYGDQRVKMEEAARKIQRAWTEFYLYL
jgi:archaellum component FlaC